MDAGMSLRSIINRIYYSMFYTVLAILSLKGIGSSKHSFVISMFDKEFVKTGIFNKDYSKMLHRAFELRKKGDYEKEVQISKNDIDKLLPAAQDLIIKTEEYLKSSGI